MLRCLRLPPVAGRRRAEWPDLLLLLGDQVYADSPSPEMLEFIHARRDSEPKNEIADFEEYAELYRQAWTDPEIRWLLSTVPTAMIFDDHDLRDDWNTSMTWREQMAETTLVAAPGGRRTRRVLDLPAPRQPLAGRAGGRAAAARAAGRRRRRRRRSRRLRRRGPTPTRPATGGATPATSATPGCIMIDTRCARQLTPGDRRMLDPAGVGLARRGGRQARRPADHRLVDPVPAARGRPRRAELERGAVRRRVGPPGGATGRRSSGRPSTWSTGRPSAGRSRSCPGC